MDSKDKGFLWQMGPYPAPPTIRHALSSRRRTHGSRHGNRRRWVADLSPSCRGPGGGDTGSFLGGRPEAPK